MNCTDFEQEWSEQLDSTPPEWSAAATVHLADCADCRRWLALQSVMDRAIEDWKQQPIPSISTDRILAAILAVQADQSVVVARADVPVSRPSRALSTISASLMTTVTAMTLLIVGWSFWQPDELVKSPSVAELEAVPEDVAPVTATVAEFWQDVRTGSAHAAQRTVQTWDQLPTITQRVRVTANTPPAESNAVPAPIEVDSPSSPRTELISEWSNLTRPLGQKVGTALQFLGTVLPSEAPPAS
ncbi:hypothetical protein GC163_15455 [bacterium]|nr:hypothetical protein [bacterium]